MGRFISTSYEGTDRERSSPHPGYRWISTSSDERRFIGNTDATNGQEVIEVFGQPELIGPDECHAKIITTLSDGDAKAYDLLQWDDPWRHHPDVAMVSAFKFFIILVLVAIIQAFVGAIFLPIESLWLRIPAAIVLSIIASILEGALYEFLVARLKRFAYFLILVFHLLSQKRKSTSLSHYRQLFETLADASCKDKAETAAFMARFLRLAA